MASKKPSKPKADKPAAKTGRPSNYTPELAEALCERLAHGEPLARICQDEGMPHFTTVWRWEQKDEAFRKLSARARELGTHYLADDSIRIADDPTIDPQSKRIMVDTRLRLIGKWNKAVYGDRQQIEHSGEMGIKHSGLSDAERVAEIQRLQTDPDVLAALRAKA